MEARALHQATAVVLLTGRETTVNSVSKIDMCTFGLHNSIVYWNVNIVYTYTCTNATEFSLSYTSSETLHL